MNKLILVVAVIALMCVGVVAQATTTVQGFEVNTGDWAGTITRASSPLNPAGGSSYAIVQADASTFFDRARSTVWTGPYTQSIDVYIDTAAGVVGNAWNFDMAIRKASDGSYLDAAGIGAGKAADGWWYVTSTGDGGSYTSTSGGTKIATSGWYTIGVDWTAGSNFLTRHAFVEHLNGAEINSWDDTMTDKGLVIGGLVDDQVGGPSYGWFSQLTMSGGLAVDNATLTDASANAAVPEPMSIMLGIMGLGSVAGFRKLRRK